MLQSAELQSGKTIRALIATLALSIAAGCAEQAAPLPQAAVATNPDLAGAWYQVFFNANSSEIDARGQMIVRNVAYVVANTEDTSVAVIGKTDRVDASSANLALSQQRADQVRDALIAAGVPASRIETSWTGESRQRVATADEVIGERNRVVDITVIKQSNR